jgi:hypothetical protein
MMVPPAVPDIRPSDIRSISVTPWTPSFRGIGITPASGIPGLPTGPMCFNTSTESFVTSKFGSSMRLARSAGLSKTAAVPRWDSKSRFFEALALMTALRNAAQKCLVKTKPTHATCLHQSTTLPTTQYEQPVTNSLTPMQSRPSATQLHTPPRTLRICRMSRGPKVCIQLYRRSRNRLPLKIHCEFLEFNAKRGMASA